MHLQVTHQTLPHAAASQQELRTKSTALPLVTNRSGI